MLPENHNSPQADGQDNDVKSSCMNTLHCIALNSKYTYNNDVLC